MVVTCPHCASSLAPEDINVEADTALCRSCGEAARFSDLLHPHPPSESPVPPRGTWDNDDGVERCIGASTRSPMALVLVPFMCVWSGLSLGGIYGSQIVSGKFNPVMSLFELPFLAGSLIFWAWTAMTVFG